MPGTFEGKTLLVTGATGFVGNHLVERLRPSGAARLVLLSRRQNLQGRRPKETWVAADLQALSPSTWRGAGVNHIDVVFHLGGFTPKVSGHANQLEEAYAANLHGTWRLLESFPSTPERIVFASTLDVYGPPGGNTILSETSSLAPAGLYGASKLFAEQAVLEFARKHGCGCAILRYGHLFGPGEDAYQKLIPLAIRNLLEGQAPTLYGDGGAERDFLYVADAVEATLRASTSPRAQLGPVNIVRGVSIPARDVIGIIAAAMGVPGRIHYLGDRPCGHSLRFDNALMRELLGQWPLVSLEEGLRREIQALRRAA